jgi:hypothetical protein
MFFCSNFDTFCFAQATFATLDETSITWMAADISDRAQGSNIFVLKESSYMYVNFEAKVDCTNVN